MPVTFKGWRAVNRCATALCLGQTTSDEWKWLHCVGDAAPLWRAPTLIGLEEVILCNEFCWYALIQWSNLRKWNCIVCWLCRYSSITWQKACKDSFLLVVVVFMLDVAVGKSWRTLAQGTFTRVGRISASDCSHYTFEVVLKTFDQLTCNNLFGKDDTVNSKQKRW